MFYVIRCRDEDGSWFFDGMGYSSELEDAKRYASEAEAKAQVQSLILRNREHGHERGSYRVLPVSV